MLYLLFQLGKSRYALESGCIVEVLPYLNIKEIPGAARGIAGLINYRGSPLPVVDLCLVAAGVPTPETHAARIIVAKVQDGDVSTRELGVLVPRATEVLRASPAAFVSANVSTPAAPYLGGVLTHPTGIIQQVEVARLLTDAVRRALFARSEAA